MGNETTKKDYSFKAEQDRKKKAKAYRYLESMPKYVTDFIESRSSAAWNTKLAYLSDLHSFFDYEQTISNAFKDTDQKEIPVSLFSSIKPRDLEEWTFSMQEMGETVAEQNREEVAENDLSRRRKRNTGGSDATIRRKLATMSAFYKYLRKEELISSQCDPISLVDRPREKVHKIITLSAPQVEKLLNGVKSNSKYLYQSQDGTYSVLDIDRDTMIKRERFVSRNYAIIYLFLGVGLRVSELAGLNLKDVDFDDYSLTVIRKGGNEDTVYFGAEVASALLDYLNGGSRPADAFSTEFADLDRIERFDVFCKEYCNDPKLLEIAKKTYNCSDQKFLDFIDRYCHYFRCKGRIALIPKRFEGEEAREKQANTEQAFFLSNRGTRMSVKMIERMVNDMVLTYLPELHLKYQITCHKLRSTCASRILAQTSNIALSAKQLGHTVSVDEKYYSVLQDKQQKSAMAKLSVTDY